MIKVKGFDTSSAPHSTLRSRPIKGDTQRDESTIRPLCLENKEVRVGEGGEDQPEPEWAHKTGQAQEGGTLNQGVNNGKLEEGKNLIDFEGIVVDIDRELTEKTTSFKSHS